MAMDVNLTRGNFCITILIISKLIPMDVCKHFAAGLTTVTFRSAYLHVVKTNLSSRLLGYVRFLNAIPFEDGKYHAYFGEVQRLAGSFVTFWTETMDEAYKENDKLANLMTKESLMSLIDNTIKFHVQVWEDFKEALLPIETSEQKEIYDEKQRMHRIHMNTLREMMIRARGLENQQRVEAFAREQLSKCLPRTKELFLYTETYISMLLADHLAEIRGSLQDILQRLRKNTVDLQVASKGVSGTLLHQIYDLEKELMRSSRDRLCERDSYLSTATLNSDIAKIRERVVASNNHAAIKLLQDEEKYFDAKLKEFDHIESTLIRLKVELESAQKEQAEFYSIKTELPDSDFECCQHIEEKYGQRLEFVQANLFEAAKTLLTFFCLRGPSRILRTDSVGPFYVDDYGHQVYDFLSGLRPRHVDCAGNLKEVKEAQYFYDSIGRYVYENGEKVYRLLDCTSSHQLGEDWLLKKVTADCGHSEQQNPDCGMRVNHSRQEILPKTRRVDITRTLDAEAVRYLWAKLGAVLPDALSDVGALQPKNPIHYLAHRLLAHKYNKTKSELLQKDQEAEAYRAKILRSRKEKPVVKSERKAEQPRNKCKYVDDGHDRAQYNLYVATNEFIRSISYD